MKMVARPSTSAAVDVDRARLPRNLAETYREYAFSPIDRRGAFAYGSGAEWKAIAVHCQQAVRDALLLHAREDHPLLTQEWEFVEKGMVCWRDKGLGTLVVFDPDKLDRRDVAQAEAFRAPFLRLGAEYAALVRRADTALLRQWRTDALVPVNKGKGAPTWHPGSDRTAAIALAAITRGSKNAIEMNQRVAEVVQASMPACVTSYLRIQGARKPQPEYAIMGGRLDLVGERRGPKTRRVQALSFALNYAVSLVAPVLRWCMKTRTTRNSGTIVEAADAVRRYQYSVAVDLASYDESVSLETLTLYRELVLHPVYSALRERGYLQHTDVELLLSIDAFVQTAPLLAPPRADAMGASLWRRAGGIVSGERLTSQKGSDINRERIDLKMDHVGLVGEAFNAGDDTIICTNDRAALDRYVALEEFMGFTETLSVDPSFLMKRLPGGYAYLGRMLFNTVNREYSHEPAGYAMAAAAVAIRRVLLEGHPAAGAYLTTLATAPSDRLRAAASLAGATTVLNLLLTAAASVSKNATETEDLSDAADLALQAGALTIEDRRRLEAALARSGNRSVMGYDEIDGLGRDMGRHTASRYLRETAYTTRKKG